MIEGRSFSKLSAKKALLSKSLRLLGAFGLTCVERISGVLSTFLLEISLRLLTFDFLGFNLHSIVCDFFEIYSSGFMSSGYYVVQGPNYALTSSISVSR